ncbi:fumarylacetoacetate hydrolase family protein [Bordetella avium]|uniref:5-carboxymethyl-2-oxo-hex-3-ene-1,7-dioate decarboxylase n=1 Tax=Bordetella avium (strain 197N) TaxID=360910 RepID=Q2L319_BORA1|nr:fumarylacetoacetate hydrolase family protein [Bordetella avium]RIQ54573.1 2-hydroxyhepta-2,4-diene-1,7-dioate isomerase [Bordetella avium]RIQ70931.1 2-hydroxyhepta-2,4-diene-1,7-dioate isomerase [Bordetella avium]CAJ48870.1 putative 5-carboxymethyl-2-oxo-hex-3-ene-1,7-dioate decarboxylase [Bordetella avium 197N]
MKHARVIYENQIWSATEAPKGVRLSDGRVLAETDVQWLPPCEFGTIFALGLNYADHAKEIAFNQAPQAPLVFLKGINALTGHRRFTRRPADVSYMHYECELAVIIGQTCRNVPSEHAYEVVRGYTVANDYAIRDYLENFYRPNLRVKSRDACTPIGPWMVDAVDIPDPMNLRFRTWVNGTLTQDGSSREMVHDIPSLIAYLSSIMTLNPGDLILTGTPEGVVDCQVGDEIVTEVEGVGNLVNTIGGDELLGQWEGMSPAYGRRGDH